MTDTATTSICKREPYTGPKWLGPLFWFMLAGFALKIAVNLICDCTQEWVHDSESEGK
jgi:hypothetical protein